ncbi:hypothetical protein QJS10_CPB13g00393 [Acorus calamus]|uniref:Interferon-related developmental regulator 1 n=1 Tax=Acorus calamus TaxID=4465 RepID=A0AAV9DJU5_ACOCL|nr:hypothetical protein QJS10_CPB13g00393 [Acorus calamus]
MGKAFFDSDDDSLSSTSTVSEQSTVITVDRVRSRFDDLDGLLDNLYEKRSSTRENALSGLVSAFESNVLVGYVSNKYITLLNQYINSIKRGSALEAKKAARAIGLLALTIGAGVESQELMVESVPHLTQALKVGSDASKKSAVLECLAIITFIGATDAEATDKVMKIIWDFMHPKSGLNVSGANKLSSPVLVAAVSAWSFLLTVFDGWRISSNNWQESISFLTLLLDKDDRSVRIAAGEAIALIFETGRLDKFSKELTGSFVEGSNGNNIGGFGHVEALKGKILNRARDLSAEAGGKGTAKKDLNDQRDLFHNVVDFIEHGVCPETSIKICGEVLTLSTWAQVIQMNYLKRFLGVGFNKHMQENELLHDVFDFTPKGKQQLSVKEKRIFRSPNSALNKTRTQVLNKSRMLAQDRQHGHFAVTHEDA